MRDSRPAEERLADLRADILMAFENSQIDRITELLSDNVDLHDADLADLSEPDVPDYRTQLRDVMASLREEGIQHRDREDIGRRLGLLCFACLALASLASMGELLTPELIDTAVKTGYRDVPWGLAAARQLANPQEELDAQLALVSRLPPGPQRLRIYDYILKQHLGKMVWYEYEATELLVQALPRELLPELRDLTVNFVKDHHGARPRALALIAARFEEPEKSKIIAEALQAARNRRNTWGHAMTILSVLPQVPRTEKQVLKREFVDAVAESLRSSNVGQFEDLTLLADVDDIGPRFLVGLITKSTGTDHHETGRLSPEQRDRLLANYAERLAGRRRVIEAFQVVRAIRTDEGRATATWLVLQAMERWLVFAILTLPKPAPSLRQRVNRLISAGLLRTGPGGSRRLRQRLLSQARALDRDERTVMLWGLLPHLPDDLAISVRTELGQILGRADTADRHERRQVITGLANLAGVSPGPDRETLLSRAFELAAIGDEDERRILAAEIHRTLRQQHHPPDHAALIESLDRAKRHGTEPEVDFTRLPDELIALAWETPWATEPPHFRQFAVLASQMARLGTPDAALDRLAALISSLRPESLAELLESLPADLATLPVTRCLIERWSQADPDDSTGRSEEDFMKVLEAVTRMASRLPDDVVHAIVEWDRSARSRRRWHGYVGEEIAACLAPLYARAGYLDEARAMTASMTAGHEKARALAGIAKYLPDHERLSAVREALALARSVGHERVQTEYQHRFAEALIRLAGATRFDDIVADTPDRRALATIAALLPAEEAAGVWREAIDIMPGPEILDFIDTMPGPVARDAIASIIRRSADSHSEHEVPTIRAILSRTWEESREAQFERLVDFMTEAASHGRPVLLRQLGAVTMLLMELGGDGAIDRLRQAVYRAATWWP